MGLGELAGVPCPDVGLVRSLAGHPDVVDWLLTVTEKQAVRRIYLDWLCRFLQWTDWRVEDLWRIKKEALKEGETKSEVEARAETVS